MHRYDNYFSLIITLSLVQRTYMYRRLCVEGLYLIFCEVTDATLQCRGEDIVFFLSEGRLGTFDIIVFNVIRQTKPYMVISKINHILNRNTAACHVTDYCSICVVLHTCFGRIFKRYFTWETSDKMIFFLERRI